MSEQPTLEAYKKNIQEGKFKAFRCTKCKAVIAPPLGTCYNCGNTKMEWTTVSGKGKLVSFTVIHVAPDEFAAEVPYIVGIVELEEKARLTARLIGFDPNKPESIKVGTPLKLDYEKGKSGKTYVAFRPA
jgi:uncharacterized OB-fold protein